MEEEEDVEEEEEKNKKEEDKKEDKKKKKKKKKMVMMMISGFVCTFTGLQRINVSLPVHSAEEMAFFLVTKNYNFFLSETSPLCC